MQMKNISEKTTKQKQTNRRRKLKQRGKQEYKNKSLSSVCLLRLDFRLLLYTKQMSSIYPWNMHVCSNTSCNDHETRFA